MSSLNTELPVRLIRMYVSKGGNCFNPGVYKPGELPKAAYTSYYCVQDSPEVIVEKVPLEPKRDLNIDLTPPNEQVTEIKAEQYKVASNRKVKINNLSKEEIADNLKGIGRGTATKVIEYREQSPFVDYNDLNARVPLPFGRNWNDYALNFEVE